MSGSFRIARIGGIDIRLHFTFLLILPVIALTFAQTFAGFQRAAVAAGVPPEQVRGSPFFWGTALAIALFLSVLIHELAHSLLAIRKGAKVRDITLLMVGGVSSLEEGPRDPKQEALVALVGPAASMALAGVLYALSLALRPTTMYSVRFAIFYLAVLNLSLGLFNLLPAFPMDGGRILRGLLAGRMGEVRATQVAAMLGKAFAFLFVIAGIFSLNFFLVLIAMFVYIGAEAEAAQVLTRSVLGDVRVSDLLRPEAPAVDAVATVEDAANRMLRDRQLALLVRRADEILGLVTLDDVAAIAPDGRSNMLVADVARPAPAVERSANVWDAFRLMSEKRLPLVPVVDAGRLVGVLTHEDVVRGLRLYQLRRPLRAFRPAVARERTA
jgi:Zn-dependent protease